MTKNIRAIAFLCMATLFFEVSAHSNPVIQLKVNALAASTPLKAPAISYTATQTFTVGTPIPSLRPTNKGGAVGNYIYGQTTSVAGSSNIGFADGTGSAAAFSYPMGFAFDTKGNMYLADFYNHSIRKVTTTGVVSTIAGTGSQGYVNATGRSASFSSPADVAADAAGNIFVADRGNARIRKITPAGVVTTFAGSGARGSADGKGTAATFLDPTNIAIDASGNLYVADQDNVANIRKITPTGVVTTFVTGYSRIAGLATDAAGNVYITAYNYMVSKNVQIIKISPKGVKTIMPFVEEAGPISVDAYNNIFVTAFGKIVKVSPSGTISTIPAGFTTGSGLAIDASGNLYAADINQSEIKKVVPTGYSVSPALPPGLKINGLGIISGTPLSAYPATNFKVTAYNEVGSSSYTINITVKTNLQAPAISYASAQQVYTTGIAIKAIKPLNTGGSVPAGTYGQVNPFVGSTRGGFADGKGAEASLYYPMGITFDAKGTLYVADQENNRIRKVTADGVVSTLAGNGSYGATNGTGTAANFFHPSAIAVDGYGNVFVADRGSNVIRKITAAGVVTTFAGKNINGTTDGVGNNASFNLPTGITIDYKGNLYVTEPLNNHIRKITPEGVVTTFAGSGAIGSANGKAATATFNYPTGITIDAQSNLYVADQNNNMIRKITPAGVVSTVAGNGKVGIANGPTNGTRFNNPYAVAVDNTGNVYVADYENNQIRVITTNGTTATVAGSAQAGSDNGTGAAAKFNHPSGIALDSKGNLFEGDFYNHEVRKINVTGYTIKPALPDGLVFDSTTGTISGTPKKTDKATDYVVTAYNAGGSSSTKINITVIEVAATTNPSVKPPVIDYGTPKVYTENVAITPVIPDNSGGAMPAIQTVVSSIYAGTGKVGAEDGSVTSATFELKQGTIAVDPMAGTLFVADQGNNVIRRISTDGKVTTLAGSGKYGNKDGTGSSATFNGISYLLSDYASKLIVVDGHNTLVRMISPEGKVTTIAGGGKNGLKFTNIQCITFGFLGDMYLVDNGHLIHLQYDGRLMSDTYNKTFLTVGGITIERAGNIYLACSDNYIRKIAVDGKVSILAGSGTAGFADGTGPLAKFNNPKKIMIDGYSNNFFVSDQGNNRVRVVTHEGKVFTYAGNGKTTLTNGDPLIMSFGNSSSFAVDLKHNFYIADNGNNVIRKIALTGYKLESPSYTFPQGLNFNSITGIISGSPAGVSGKVKYVVTAYNQGGTSVDTVVISVNNAADPAKSPNIYTIAGNFKTWSSGEGDAQPYGITSSAGRPSGLVVDKSKNIYVASGDNRVLKVDAQSKKITVVAGTGVAGFSGDGGLAVKAQLHMSVPAIAIDSDGNIYVSDNDNNRVRKIDAKTQKISTVAGTGVYADSTGSVGDGGLATAAQLAYPQGLAIDSKNNLYIAETWGGRIRVVDAKTHKISTFASGFDYLTRITVDKNGNIYYGNLNSAQIIKIDAITHQKTIFAGVYFGLSGDNGYAINANLYDPRGLTFDKNGNMYFADWQDDVVRRIDGTTGIITTIAGMGINGYKGDGEPAILSQLSSPGDVAVDDDGAIYIADCSNLVIRKIGGQDQTITFPAIAAKKTGTADFSPGATASSKLSVTYTSSNKAVATIVSGKIHIVAAGTAVITASQAGNFNYAPAVDVTQKLTVTKATVAKTLADESLNTDLSAPVVKASLSPNGDGVNDALIIDHIASYPTNKVTLIDVNGNKIYETAGYDNQNKVYKGKSNITGAIQKAGTYYYLLDYKDGDEVKHMTGYIIIKY